MNGILAPRFANLILGLLLLLGGAATAHSAPEPGGGSFPSAARVVSFADVHGDYPDLLALLGETGLVDASGNWAGGNAVLVSTGDLLDRGPESRKVLDLLMRLQEQAPKAGGALHLALGNHEVMVMSGDLRYVSAAEYAAFAGEETAADREALFKAWAALQPDKSAEALRPEFDKNFPPGYVALRKAFAPDGRYGQWLLAQPVVLKVGDTVYMHGGVSSGLADFASIEEANARFSADLRDYLGLVADFTRDGVMPPTLSPFERMAWLGQSLTAWQAQNGKKSQPPWLAAAQRFETLDKAFLFGDTGPIWYRGTAMCHPVVAGFDAERLLARWQARRIVLGHTPTATRRVTSRMDGRVILADTGMLKSAYQGRASAVQIAGGKLTVHYAGEPGDAAPVNEVLRVPRQPPDMDDATLEKFLREAPVVAKREVGTGITKPLRLTLEKDGVKLDAVYKNHDSDPGLESRERFRQGAKDENDRYVYDVAAYKLDRLLGVGRVPVAVVREIDGKPGLVQLWVTGTVNERDRLERKIAYAGACSQRDEYRLRILFDVLIGNDDRNLTNLLWTEDDFTLVLIDHSRSFRALNQRPPQYKKTAIELPELFRAPLVALDKASLTGAVGAWLHPKQIDAVLARRDLILREAITSGFKP